MIALVGFMGSGKSEVGRALASLLDLPFADTDALVVARAGRSIESIFREEGEGRFRELEWEALRSLGGEGDRVVATGGGLFLGVTQRAFLRRHALTVWLDVSLEVARSRAPREGRPLWRDDDPIAFRAMFEKRRAAYALADLRVAASEGDPAAVAERVRAALDR